MSKLQSEVILYPNPTEAMVTVLNPTGESLVLTVFDPQGKAIHRELMSSDTVIDLSGNSSGNYLFELKDTHADRTIRKVVKY